MTKTYEVESKFEITPQSKHQIEAHLKDAKQIKTKKQTDVYYDTEDAKLFKKGIFIRLRDNHRLDFKFNPEETDQHNYCLEHKFEVPIFAEKLFKLNKTIEALNLNKVDTASFQDFLETNNLKEFVVIDKEINQYEKENITYRIDEVKELGKFIEIEIETSEEKQIKELNKKIKSIGTELNLKNVGTGYVELYLRKYNKELYLKGRYLADEDKQSNN